MRAALKAGNFQGAATLAVIPAGTVAFVAPVNAALVPIARDRLAVPGQVAARIPFRIVLPEADAVIFYLYQVKPVRQQFVR